MEGIVCNNLTKIYKKEKREEGFWNSVKHFIKKKYEYIRALDKISFEIEKGRVVGILGPNGAGKTTLMKILSGVLYPTEGEVKVEGFVPFKREKNFLRKITLFTGQRGFLSLTIWDLPPVDGFNLIRELYKIPGDDFKKRLDLFIEILNLGSVIHTPLRTLSLGERTKVELAASLLHFPEYVFLDEPTIGMDVVSQKNIWDFLKEYVKMNNATLLLTSHYIRDIEEVCEDLLVISHGRIIYKGSTEGIINKFFNKKRVEIKAEYIPADFSCTFPVEVSGDTISFEVESREARNLITEIIKKVEVVDISIKEPSLEEVIRILFGGDNELH